MALGGGHTPVLVLASRIWAEPATVCTEDSGAPGKTLELLEQGSPSPALHHHGQFHLFPLLKYPFSDILRFLILFPDPIPPSLTLACFLW